MVRNGRRSDADSSIVDTYEGGIIIDAIVSAIRLGHGYVHPRPGAVVLCDSQMVLQQEYQGQEGGHALGAYCRQSKIETVVPVIKYPQLGYQLEHRL